MEFRIHTEKMLPRGYKLPQQLTPTERVELIKQLCSEIDAEATAWACAEDGWRNQYFTDYLAEHMEK